MSRDPRFVLVRTHETQLKAPKSASASFSLCPQNRLVIAKFSGRIAADDIAKHAKGLLSRPDFKPTFSEIVDLTEVIEFNLQANDFLRLADKIDPFWPGAKRAFVARTPLQHYAARMHKILRSERKIEIFQFLEEAQKWIEET